MHIKSLSIRNFRNFKAAKFFFKEGAVNTILGENASGKTNVFHAMRLILDDSLPLNARFLSINDFHRELGQVRGHWIVLQFCFGGLGESDEELVMANHTLDEETDGIYTFVYRPKLHIRQKLYEITQDNPSLTERKEATQELLDNIIIDKEDYEVVAFTRSSIDFVEDDIYEQFAGDFQAFTFPNPEDEDAALIGAQKPAYFSLIREVTCTYVKALRNVVNDLKYAKTNPLYKLLSYKSSEISGAEEITDNVKELNSNISNLSQVKDLSKSISKTLTGAVGETYSPDISIASDLPEDISELVQSLSLIVEDSSDYKGTGNIEDLSLGGANLIYLALKLYEYEMQQAKDEKIAHFLLIEEPEAHIHNHIQKTLFSNIQSFNTQVFISTHSTQISSVSNISSINMISRSDGGSEVFWPSNGLEDSDVFGIERYLDAMRSTLLFAKSAILVEGDAEQILLPSIVKAVYGVTLDEMGISLVNMDGTVFVHISKLFHEDRIRNFCSILTDRDAPFLTKETDYANSDYIKKLKNADANGALRYEELNNHCNENKYLSPFFANNTFETELILAGNQSFFIEILTDIYTQQARIDYWKKFITEGCEPELCYAALYLANKMGKGWFAVLLSEEVSRDTKIPSYILQAISHALKGHQKQPIYKKIMEYRLSGVGRSVDAILNDVDQEWESCVDVFRDILPDDPLLELMDTV